MSVLIDFNMSLRHDNKHYTFDRVCHLTAYHSHNSTDMTNHVNKSDDATVPPAYAGSYKRRRQVRNYPERSGIAPSSTEPHRNDRDGIARGRSAHVD